uniref:Uncharacterized protein n=1 Tax=Salix viminalis TaxID=40686 RepID=A0A6N2NK64_SALVM
MLEDLQISPAVSTYVLHESKKDDKDINQKERPTRLNLKTFSTPSTQKLPKNIGRSGSLAILPKSMSCRSLGEDPVRRYILNLRVPKISAGTDMKKHLMFWARTVASEIQQEY